MAKADRFYSLDTLRGLAIFGMILSSRTPAGLPSWMYHNQVQPPDYLYRPEVTGITWVDLVFPFFMFSMGVAIPLALSHRLDTGTSYLKTIGHILFRGLVLVAFAIYLENSYPASISYHPDMKIWIRTILGFFCWLLVFGRWPFDLKNRTWILYVAKAIGIAGLIYLMSTVVFKDGTGFSKDRNDIIIRILAFAYTAGALMWLISRNSLMLRLALFAGVFALRLHNTGGGPILSTSNHWLASIHWIFSPSMIGLTLVILPGTIIGDILLNWTKRTDRDDKGLGLSGTSIVLLLLSLLAIVVGGLIFLKTHWVLSGLLFSISVCLLVYGLLRQSQTSIAKLIQSVFNWGVFLLVIGYILEPYEGGIKKDPATLSYYFVNMGMAISLLIFFYILIDVLQKGWTVGFLTGVGSNPMLGYITKGYLVIPLLNITGMIGPIDRFIGSDLTLLTIWGFGVTFLSCGATYLFTRWKIYLRV